MPNGLLWPIKASLLAYIESLDDGEVEVTEPASRRDEGFWFPRVGADDAPGPGPGVALAFSGAVRLTGHWGMMQLEFRDPEVRFGEVGAVLRLRESGRPDRFTSVADLRLQDSVEGDDGSSVTTLDATLTGEGTFLFGGQYPAGTPLGPVRIEWSPRHG